MDALREYVFRSDHAGFMRRRREWFERFERRDCLVADQAQDLPTIVEDDCPHCRRLAPVDHTGPAAAG